MLISCVTGTVAQFSFSAKGCPVNISVEAWDENGVPYVANDNGLSTVLEYAESQGCEFSRLTTKREGKQDVKEWEADRAIAAANRRARVYARLKKVSLIERQRMGIPMNSVEVERMSVTALEKLADKFEAAQVTASQG